MNLAEMVKTLIELEGELETRQAKIDELQKKEKEEVHLFYAKFGIHQAYKHLQLIENGNLKLVK
jgi:hypothetical protein